MVTLLRRLFIQDYTNIKNQKVRLAHGKLAAVFGIISNCTLVVLKITIALIIAAQSNWVLFSMALIGDAVNNLSDMASSVVTLIGFKISGKPADKDHPFGHARIEYITGLIVSIVVTCLAILLFRDSLNKVISHELIQYDLLSVIILGVSVLIKLGQGAFNLRMGKIIDSEALKATSLDSLTDAIATLMIMVSGVISYIWHINYLDGYMGMAVALFVAYSGIKMIKETANPLIGEAIDPQLVNDIVKVVLRHKQVHGVHDIVIHDYGPGKRFVSLHAEVDEKASITDSHDVIDNIEADLSKKFNCEATIHMDPIAIGDPRVETLKKEVKDELLSIDPNLHFHDFRIVSGPTHTNIIFDVVIPYDCLASQRSIYSHLEHRFAKRETAYHFVIHFDSPYTE